MQKISIEFRSYADVESLMEFPSQFRDGISRWKRIQKCILRIFWKSRGKFLY